MLNNVITEEHTCMTLCLCTLYIIVHFRYASVIDHSVDFVDHLTVGWKD